MPDGFTKIETDDFSKDRVNELNTVVEPEPEPKPVIIDESKVHRIRKVNISGLELRPRLKPLHVSSEMKKLCTTYFGRHTSAWQKLKFCMLGYPKTLSTVSELIRVCNRTFEKNGIGRIDENIEIEELVTYRIIKENLRKKIDGKFHDFLRKFLGLRPYNGWYNKGQVEMEKLYRNETQEFVLYLGLYERQSNRFYYEKRKTINKTAHIFNERDGERLIIRILKKRRPIIEKKKMHGSSSSSSSSSSNDKRRRLITKEPHNEVKNVVIKEVKTTENELENRRTTRTTTTKITVKNEVLNRDKTEGGGGGGLGYKVVEKKKKKKNIVKIYNTEELLELFSVNVSDNPSYLNYTYKNLNEFTNVSKVFNKNVTIILDESVYGKFENQGLDIIKTINLFNMLFPNLKADKAIENLVCKKKGIKFILAKTKTGIIIGSIMFRIHSFPLACEVLLMAVHAKAGGRGIGSFLMDVLKETLPPLIHVIILKADLHSGCIEFYKKNGFTFDTTLKFGRVFFDTDNSKHMECRREFGGFAFYKKKNK